MISRITDVLRTPSVHILLAILFLGITAFLAFNTTPNFDQRTIGITVLHGQDAAARNAIYVFSILGGICLLLAVFLKFPSAAREESAAGETTNLGVVLGVVLASNLILYFSSSTPVFLQAFYALAYLAVVGMIIHRRETDRDRRDYRWMLVALSYHLLLAGYSLAGEHPRFDPGFFTYFTLVLFISNLIYEKATAQDRAARVPVAQGLWPLMLLPLAIIFANEAQYTLLNRLGMPVSGHALWLASLLLLSLWGYGNYRRSRASFTGTQLPDQSGMLVHKLLVGRYLPVVVATNVAFAEYAEQINYFFMRDFFHGGESLVPIQQLLQFGAIPFVDFYPPHGVFDMLPQLFYQMANQTPYPEAVLWGEGYFLGWLPRMLAAVLVYWFLGRLLGFRTAFLVLFALPTYHLIHPYYCLLLIPAMAAGRVAKTFPQWLIFWCIVFGLVLWRVDFGIAAVAAAIFVIAAQFLSQRSVEMLARSVAAFLLVFAVLALVFLALALARQHSPTDLARQVVNYVQIQTAVTGLSRVVGQIDFAAALQYVLLPAVAVAYLAYFSSLALSERVLSSAQRVLAFVAVSSLVISLRSLNRHSHYEGVFNPYFFTLLAALSPLLFTSLSRTMRTTLFIAVCVASFMLFPRSTSLFYNAFYEKGVAREYPAPASSRAPIALKDAAPSAKRLVSEYADKENIAYFLRHFLRGNQTFYDFTNSPLLYALAGKKLPGFVSETLYHTSETGQRALIADLQARYGQGELPVVLFRQNNGWDKTDGVDNAVRSYRVAEFIYQRYVPCLTIDSYEIWLDKDLAQQSNCGEFVDARLTARQPLPAALQKAMHPAPNRKQEFDLMKLPYVWANFDEFDAIGSAAEVQALRATAIQNVGGQAYRLQFPDDFHKAEANYVHLRILSAHEGQVELSYADGNRLLFDVIANPEPQDYVIRTSTQHAWHRESFDHLDIKADFPFSLAYAAVLRGD